MKAKRLRLRKCAHWPDVVVVVRGPGGDAEEGEREEEEDGVEGGEHLQEVSERRQHVELLPRQHLHGWTDGTDSLNCYWDI